MALPAYSVEAALVDVLAGARNPIVEVRGCVLLVSGGLLKFPPTEGRAVCETAFVLRDGPVEGRALVLSRDFVLESDVRAVVAGVPVRGVDAFELAEEPTAFVGDFVGDCNSVS